MIISKYVNSEKYKLLRLNLEYFMTDDVSNGVLDDFDAG